MRRASNPQHHALLANQHGGLVGAAAFLLLEHPAQGSVGDAGTVSNIIARIVIISLLYYATFWAGGNYRALRHQQTVNQHRHKASVTFQTFVQGGETPETRDAVVREATRSIFSASATGFLGEEDTPTNNLVEIVQAAAGAKGGA